MAARAAYFQDKENAVFSAADYGFDAVEVWPENWPAWTLFCQISTQWRMRMQSFMNAVLSVPSGLDYGAIYPLLDRIACSDEEWLELFEDVQILERTALEQMSENRSET